MNYLAAWRGSATYWPGGDGRAVGAFRRLIEAALDGLPTGDTANPVTGYLTLPGLHSAGRGDNR